MKFTKARLVIYTLALTLVIEGITALFRFGFKLESSRDTASTVGVLTGGVRIHHGYFGVLILALYPIIKKKWSTLLPYSIIIGASLVMSDLIHHFLVLWPITGHHHFDIFYH